jgi:hypothetical protein
MPTKVLRITTHLPAIPNWLRIENSINIPLSLKNARELAAKLLEVENDIDIELKFSSGKEVAVEIKLDTKKE